MVRKCCIFCWTLCCLACSPRALQDAQHTVAQADSMRLARCAYNDSLSLAQAYETLRKTVQFSILNSQLSEDYARACYYYGRLLREKDQPVEAMLCFVNATRSRTTDYPLLGRIYSNMGSLCHLASAFPLACDMYERSAHMFLRAGDSTAYYYGLYRLAYEKATAADFDDCINLINMLQLPRQQDSVLDAYCYLTLAEMHLQCLQYDSTVYYARQALALEHTLLLPVIQLAQAYSLLSLKDSAVYYAQQILSRTDDLFAVNNALYILTNDDESKDKTAIRQTACDRADTQKLLEIRQGKLSQAVQILELELARKPDLNWLYAVVVSALLSGIGLVVYRRVQRNKHALWSQKIEAMTHRYSDLQAEKAKHLEQTCAALCASGDIRKSLCWKEYEAMCKTVDSHFFLFTSKLKQMQVLNEQEIRLCVLVLLHISRNQMADILPYAPNGIGKFKYRVAQKLGTDGKNLRNYLICIAIDEPLKSP